MTPSDLLAAVQASPAYARLEERTRELVLRSCEVLAGQPAGLTADELRKALRTWFPRDVLEDTIPGTLERHGLFRWDGQGRWLLIDLDGLLRPFAEMPVCVFDVEATGGRPPLHRIIELGAVRIEPNGAITTFESLINPARPLPPYISFMTGLKQSHIDKAPLMASILPELDRLLEGALLIAHDVTGDIELLNYELFRNSGKLLVNPIICTVAITRSLRPTIDRHGLESLCGELGICFAQRHRALGDAQATASVWEVLKKDLIDQGVRTLLDLTAFQGHLGQPNFFESRLSVERLEELPSTPGLVKLLGSGGRLVHVEASADVRKLLRDYFYPRYKQPPFLKKTLRETVDFTIEGFASFDEAQNALKNEKAKLPEPRRRKWRRRG